jgi:hypothetical protein
MLTIKMEVVNSLEFTVIYTELFRLIRGVKNSTNTPFILTMGLITKNNYLLNNIPAQASKKPENNEVLNNCSDLFWEYNCCELPSYLLPRCAQLAPAQCSSFFLFLKRCIMQLTCLTRAQVSIYVHTFAQ